MKRPHTGGPLWTFKEVCNTFAKARDAQEVNGSIKQGMGWGSSSTWSGFAAGRFVDFGVSRNTWSQRRKEDPREMCGLATLSFLHSSPPSSL